MTSPKGMKTIKVVTDKKIFVVMSPFIPTVKDLIEGLQSGEIRIESYRIMDGPDNERQWRYPNGEKMGMKGKGWNCIKNVIEVDKASMSHWYREIMSGFNNWRQFAQRNMNNANIGDIMKEKRKYIKKEVKVGDLIQDAFKKSEEVKGGVVTIVTIKEYAMTLTDLTEIGSIFRLIMHLEGGTK